MADSHPIAARGQLEAALNAFRAETTRAVQELAWLRAEQRQQFQVSARKAAEAKAQALLRDWLSPAQIQSYEVNGWIDVTSSTGRSWRILRGSTQGNVQLLDGQGSVLATYCAYPKNAGELPAADVHLAQALSLMSDEAAFLEVAYGTNSRTGQQFMGLPSQPARVWHPFGGWVDPGETVQFPGVVQQIFRAQVEGLFRLRVY